jgi:hypothetical protein
MTYFWKKTKGVTADIERHRAKEKQYLERIAELEGREDPVSIAARRVYRRHLNQLRDSMARTVNQLGRKK